MNIPQRMVSLSPNVSMMLFALDADAAVVGRTEHCLSAIEQYVTVWNLPESRAAQRLQHWRDLPVVGVWPLADAEPIVALQPDAILTSGSGPFGVHDAQSLGVADDAVHHFDTRTFDDLEQHIRQLGALLGKPEAAAALTEQIAARRDDILARRTGRSVAPTALFEYCVCTQYDDDPERRVANPAQTILVGGHLTPELIRLSGGEPLLRQPGETATWVTIDDIRGVQPDVVLQYDCHGCPAAGKHPVRTREGWGELAAVDRDAVYTLQENISNPNLCFPAGLEELVKLFNTYAAQNP
ncbi:ABC transporter substrate-binding protein [Candidatus Entotheonella palauensis]|uniref:ABC transporter substrate-binding protein n=1 Tax=Candidatus Entotheonella palauensis TaxID=93172 RepID=UPI0015C42704|nr:ABC transporter substrate-binding protein [Candidatus Entotheonella palauensis]